MRLTFYWIVCVSFFRVGRAFATPLGYYLELWWQACRLRMCRTAADTAASTVSVQAKRLHHSFGASEATIFSNRGSPRKGSHSGLRRKLP